MPNGLDGYGYVPEMQGMTEMLQREYINNSNRGNADVNRAMSRSNLQSSGAFLGTKARMAGARTQGVQDIATQNAYKNAMFALDDRRRKENRDFQEKQAKDAYTRQLELYRIQKKDQDDAAVQQMIGGGLGTLTGQFLGAPLGALGASLVPKAAPSALEDAYTKYIMGMIGGTK